MENRIITAERNKVIGMLWSQLLYCNMANSCISQGSRHSCACMWRYGSRLLPIFVHLIRDISTDPSGPLHNTGGPRPALGLSSVRELCRVFRGCHDSMSNTTGNSISIVYGEAAQYGYIYKIHEH
ncbi:unnamed protein product [Fusarium equiseti]|uniref:Uncharacterized protein n=1 Tax=Fusarium equiseti TaxID=61235 RepID=A0A8J2NMX4_FUSEQ|nr:unnamed protein product [Fusarium equiseti]